MANPNDGTPLNGGSGGDTISDEAFSDNSGVTTGASQTPRGLDDLPDTAYKLPRSKIAVGPYDSDGGDAIAVSGLPVQTYYERRCLEDQIIRDIDRNMYAGQTHGKERIGMCDRRGGSGQRGLR